VANGVGRALVGDGITDEDVVGQAAVPSRPERSRPKGIQSRKLDLRQGYLPIPIQAATKTR
jgi:hypothetical protein